MNRRERRAAGRKSVNSSQSSPAATPDALHEAGLDHMRAGRTLDAQICCQQALAINPDHADTLHLMGLLSAYAQDHDHAVEWISRAIRQDPKPEYLSSLGATLQQQGRLEEALQVFDKVVQLRPDDDEGWINLGKILRDLNRPAEALLSFQHVLTLSPHHWDAAFQSGSILHKEGRFEEAVKHFDLCHELRPADAPTLQLRGLSQAGLKRFEEYLADSLAAHAIDPNNAETRNNIGGALLSLGRCDEALGWFDEALKIQPNLAEALNNKIVAMGQLHRFDDAFALGDRLKTLGLSNTRTEWILAHLHLLTGNFEAGWAGNEVRLELPSSAYPKFPLSRWTGDQAIEGKTILVCADEGLGDTIQFVRYVPMLIERGAQVVLVVQNPLHGLLSGLVGISLCLSFDGGQLPHVDVHCPICSLPLAFGTRLDSIPSTKSYLPSPAKSRVQAWEDRLGPRGRLRVGVVWSGSLTHTNDHNRSIPLRTFSRILDVEATFVSLQKDPRPNDIVVLRERSEITDLTADLVDFTETAALISCLDLVITVDTSVAHLAGALGCPTWLLLPFTPDWRWLLDRDDSPWYPSMRLFRQSETREYATVIDRVQSELRTLISTKQRQESRPENLSSLGTTLQQQGRLEEALQVFDKAVQLGPDDGEGWINLGKILGDLNRPAEALLSFQHVLELNPQHWEAANSAGILLHGLGRVEEALSCFNLCDEIQPNHVPTLYTRGRTLMDLERFEEALADNQRAHALDPMIPDICDSIGSVLQRLKRPTEALQWFDRALRLQPNFVSALINKAGLLAEMRRLDECFAVYARLKAIEPENADAEWNLSLVQLLTGNFVAGWAGREARWRVPLLSVPFLKVNQPQWGGEGAIEGKTILIWVDEGLGDTIQFARYVPMLAERGARVILFVQDAVVALLSGLSGVSQCISSSARARLGFDLHCPLGSLPLAFRTTLKTIPSPKSYLPLPDEACRQAWQDRLGPQDRFRVGLVWSGNPKHKNDHNRSIPLQMLSRILDVDATFVSLQKDPRPEDKAALLERTDIVDLTEHLTDFVETAALISCLDLVITVDTSAAHLSGALGRPTWVLLPYTPDDRWLLDRDDSPWYPTLRLFRQTETRDYGEVLDRVRDELATLIATDARPRYSSGSVVNSSG
jgi:tetratricopeptide (TPR) repeat protein